MALQVDVGPAADLPPGFFESVRAGTPPRASSSDSGGVLGEDCSAALREDLYQHKVKQLCSPAVLKAPCAPLQNMPIVSRSSAGSCSLVL